MELILRFFAYLLVHACDILFAGLVIFFVISKWWRFARTLALSCLSIFVALMLLMPNVLTFLENRFDVPDIKGDIEGIVVLGGSFSKGVGEARDVISFNNDSAGRLTDFM